MSGEARGDAPFLRESPTWWSAEPRHERGRVLYVNLEYALAPSTGDCICHHWWIVHPEKGVAFYYQPFGYGRSDHLSPQCNSVEATAKMLVERGWPGHEARYIGPVYMAHAGRAMQADRAALSPGNRKDGSSQQTSKDPTQ